MQSQEAGTTKSSKSKVSVLVDFRHVEAMKTRYALGTYDIGEPIAGMLSVTLKRKDVRDAMRDFDAKKLTDNIIVFSIRRRAQAAAPAQKKRAEG